MTPEQIKQEYIKLQDRKAVLHDQILDIDLQLDALFRELSILAKKSLDE